MGVGPAGRNEVSSPAFANAKCNAAIERFVRMVPILLKLLTFPGPLISGVAAERKHC